MKMPKKINKKAFAYLLIASILIAIILIVFLTMQKYKYQDKQNIDTIRIKTLNDFVKGFTADVERATYISAYRSLLALEDNIATKGEFFTNTEEQFRETFFNGTINGTTSQIVNGTSFKDYLSKVNQIANTMNINITANIQTVYLEQTDPWNIKVIVESNFIIEDKTKLASWNLTKNITTTLPIENLRDPLYSTYTSNRVPNTIIKNPYTEIVNQTNNDTTNLEQLINNSYYIESTNAPTFLMRFENNNSPHQYGIESIVNIEELSDQDIEVYADRVKTDYIYFNDLTESQKICNVQDIPTKYELILPENRKEMYQIENLAYDTTCT